MMDESQAAVAAPAVSHEAGDIVTALAEAYAGFDIMHMLVAAMVLLYFIHKLPAMIAARTAKQEPANVHTPYANGQLDRVFKAIAANKEESDRNLAAFRQEMAQRFNGIDSRLDSIANARRSPDA